MMRSLTSGETGIKVHQTEMDVIGNNISNVNTIGYKAGRITFQEVFTQTLKSALRPGENGGGTNPIQVGLGLSVGSVDTDLEQGKLDATGMVTDLSIEGDGYFIVSDGYDQFYSRAGAFQFDAQGRLVTPSNGFVLQGKMADSSGNITARTQMSNIEIPFGQKTPANATTNITFKGNLDASADPPGTVLDTKRLYAIEQFDDNSDVENLYAKGNANAQITGLVHNSTIVSVEDGLGNTQTYTYVETDSGIGFRDFHSLQDLFEEIEADFGANGVNSFATTWNNDGSMSFNDLSGADENMLAFTSSNANLQLALSAANGDLIQAATTSDQFSHVATSNDVLTELRNYQGDDLGLVNGDEMVIAGLVGETVNYDDDGQPIPSHSGALNVAEDTTLQDFLDQIKTTFTVDQEEFLNEMEIDADGSVKISGYGGTANKVTYLNFYTADNPAGQRTIFDGVFDSTVGNWDRVQEAEDAEHSTTTTIYDSLGNSYVMTMTFTKDTKNDKQWFWEADVPSDYESSGYVSDNGTITFNPDGSLASFEFDRGNTYFEFFTKQGAEPLKISLDMGDIGDVTGISQFSSPHTVVSDSQDGYSAGYLTSIGIDEGGIVRGVYTNGQSQVLAQIMLADFNNPGGLLRVGNNLFQDTGNSGIAIIGSAGETIQGSIIPGSLEQSNVDIARELTNMILAQRGFQANSRVITTSDEMLTELVNLKR